MIAMHTPVCYSKDMKKHMIFCKVLYSTFFNYRKIYTELKSLLIALGATEDQASRSSNIYCVKYLNEIFNDYESATCDKKSDWKFTSKITCNE
jgi:hypothetical protein